MSILSMAYKVAWEFKTNFSRLLLVEIGNSSTMHMPREHSVPVCESEGPGRASAVVLGEHHGDDHDRFPL